MLVSVGIKIYKVIRSSARSIVCAIAILLLPSILWAQQAGGGGGGTGGSGSTGHAAGLQFGQVWPAGTLGEGVDGSIAPGLFYEYSASQIFALQVNLIRSSHNDRLSIFSTTTGIKANLFFFDQLVPYAFAGVGLYFVNKKLPPNYTSELGTTHFGLNLGIGADLNLGPQFFTGMWLGLHNLFSASGEASSSSGNTGTGSTQEMSGRWSALFLRVGMRF